MPYEYEKEKQKIFTDEGQRKFLKIRDKVIILLRDSGAFKMNNIVEGDGWLCMAFVDRMVELGEIREVTGPDVFGQDRVFVSIKI